MPFQIDDSTGNDVLFPPGCKTGHDPSQVKTEMFAPLTDIPLIPRSEWDARIKEQTEQESSLEHLWLRQGKDHLDQDGFGYCWAHSTTHAVMVQRCAAHQPFVPLSAFAVAAIIKHGKDEGGWCGLSAKFARENGIPDQKYWPQGSTSLKYDTPEMRANMALHKINQDFVDVNKAVYDQNLTFDMLASCLFQNVPCPVDFNWWGHSVCAVRITKDSDGYGLRILNSWKGWGEQGFATLKGSRSKPDGALAIVSTLPSRS